MKSTLIHIPHSSACIPPRYLPLFAIRGRALADELRKMTDWFTDDLFADCGECVTFPISRLVCDVERFRRPELECMTAKGMWVCYENTSDLTRLKTTSPAHCREILQTYYDPHHARLTAMTERMLLHSGRVLLIDAHSFSPVRLPYEAPGLERPDICIGTDAYHTPQKLAAIAVERFSALGYSVAVNTPFSGCMIPLPYYRKDARVTGLMIEVNRRLYMTPDMTRTSPCCLRIKRDITAVVGLLSKTAESL